MLEGVGETPAVLAVKATLLFHTGQYEAAKELASRVPEPELSAEAVNVRAAWIKALAVNVVGRVAYEENRLSDAETAFAQATAHWQLAGKPQIALGTLMNRANVLYKLGRFEAAETIYQEVLSRAEDDVLRVRVMSNLGELYGSSGQMEKAYGLHQEVLATALKSGFSERHVALIAGVYNDLGYSLWQLGKAGAREHLERALNLAQEAGERALFANTLGNLALIGRDAAKLEVALELMEQLGDNHELEIYRKRYETLLIERWLASESSGDLRSLLSVSERLRSHYETQNVTQRSGCPLGALRAVQRVTQRAPNSNNTSQRRNLDLTSATP